MNTSLVHIIKKWVPEKSKVIDFGCGDGSLLKDLIDEKNIRGYGVEIDHNKIQECILKGISVIEKDIDEGIQDFESCNFDVAVMASSIQCLKEPHLALRKMLKLSKQCIVTLPNLGFWKCRLDLAQGRMPVTPNLPSSWYETLLFGRDSRLKNLTFLDPHCSETLIFRGFQCRGALLMQQRFFSV